MDTKNHTSAIKRNCPKLCTPSQYEHAHIALFFKEVIVVRRNEDFAWDRQRFQPPSRLTAVLRWGLST